MSKKNIAVTAGMISLLTMISKCIGFVREMVMAGCYGTSRISDIYVLSNTIPTGVLGALFLAVATAYMPLLAENDRKGNADRFTRQVITIMNMIAAVSVLLGCLCSGWLVRMFGYSGDAARIAEFFCRVSFCFVMFISHTDTDVVSAVQGRVPAADHSRLHYEHEHHSIYHIK